MSFWQIVERVLNDADIILEVIDARMIDKTRNLEIERKVQQRNKILIRVINKCDLVDKKYLEKQKKLLQPCVFVSAKNFLGTTMLRKKIMQCSRGEAVVVGVVGYPNTGKSSVINALKGKASAKVSSVSGYTTGKQNVRADNKINLIDTPGVLSDTDTADDKQIKIATKNFYDEKDPDIAFYELLSEYRNEILIHYGLIDKVKLNNEEILIELAKKFNKFKTGGLPDVEITAKKVLKDWQHGKIQV